MTYSGASPAVLPPQCVNTLSAAPSHDLKTALAKAAGPTATALAALAKTASPTATALAALAKTITPQPIPGRILDQIRAAGEDSEVVRQYYGSWDAVPKSLRCLPFWLVVALVRVLAKSAGRAATWAAKRPPIDIGITALYWAPMPLPDSMFALPAGMSNSALGFKLVSAPPNAPGTRGTLLLAAVR
jgi:hypothetical protein